jgi:hypothetical protein
MEMFAIKESVRCAIIDCISEKYDGYNKRFAEKLGVHPSLIGEWIKPVTDGKYKNVKADLWGKLQPLIRPYLKDVPAPTYTDIPVKQEQEARGTAIDRAYIDEYFNLPIDAQKRIRDSIELESRQFRANETGKHA